MLTPRRALTAAFFILAIFFLGTRSSNAGIALHADASSVSSATNSAAGANVQANVAGSNGVAKQRPMIDMSKMSLRDKLEYTYTYDVASKFPAYIWQTWKNTPGDSDFQFREEEASWSVHHPGFIHEVITDEVALPLVRLLYSGVPEVIDAYRSLPLPVLKADFFRYLILYARGGIYSDIDTKALKSASEWVPKTVPRDSFGLVIGIEADPDRPDWAEWYSRRIQFCQWTMKAKPGHPVLREVISRITEETLKRKAAGTLDGTLDKNVIEFTGPAVWTDAIMGYFNDPHYFKPAGTSGPSTASVDTPATPAIEEITWRNFTGMKSARRLGDVVVLPITGFSPGVGQMGARGYEDPQAMVRHEFEGTWKPESERNIGESNEKRSVSAVPERRRRKNRSTPRR